MNNTVIKLDDALLALKGQQITRFFPYHNHVHITFSNGTKISTSAYSYVDSEDVKHDTSIVKKSVEDELNLLASDVVEFTSEMKKELTKIINEREEKQIKCQGIGEGLQKIIEEHMPNLSIEEIKYQRLDTFKITFNEIENFYIELYADSFSGYRLRIETENYDFIITDTNCKIAREKVEKDYKSFSSAAKSRFRTMAKDLGYEQITGIVYVKEREDWYETFNLQSSQYGNPFFYINYGVILPKKFPLLREELRDSGWNLGGRLCPEESNSFSAGNKRQIEESATLALELYKKQVVPWFESLTLEKIQKEINRR